MTQFLLFVSTFLDFWFLPFVIGLIVSIIIEQVLRASGNQYDPKAVKKVCLLYTSPSPRDKRQCRMPSSA